MKHIVDRLLSFVLSRRSMVAFNRLLLMAAMRGLGIGNWRSKRGERLFLGSLAGLLPAGAVVLDIGANRGGYAALVRNALLGARIFCFEPAPGNLVELEDLAHSLSLFVVPVAVGAAPGKLTLYDYADGKGSSHASVFKGVIEDLHQIQSGRRSMAYEVSVTTIDLFLRERGIDRVDLLKIDVEGFELAVMKGAAEALAAGRIGIVQFEFSELNIYGRNFLQDFREFLLAYDFYRILDNGELLPLDGLPTPLVELFHYQNIVARLREPVPRVLPASLASETPAVRADFAPVEA
jgi:FkbM family methyltransferase